MQMKCRDVWRTGHGLTLFSLYFFSIVALICLGPLKVYSRSIPGFPQVNQLRKETEDLFYHGFENYMRHGFPEDELRPVSCRPLTRDRNNPRHIEVNDPLGNYSLTLIDSLSTLAILASTSSGPDSNKPLLLFQDGVRDLVQQYGDGREGESGQGLRERGFDLDSKVQVFETVIRGLGGLLSAHLFAVGDLPIRGYTPPSDQAAYAQAWDKTAFASESTGIQWQNGMTYDGQLLRLAYDLGKRLLPAFWTITGIPYPRVNLRYGIPFYKNSPANEDAGSGQCDSRGQNQHEITETCSAGAGSLVLEFAVLSRLTGDTRFEDLAKRAFWAIWSRRSDIGLIGAGIDAETGSWVHSWTGIGAGVDSFFEYAFKSHVLLSQNARPPPMNITGSKDPRVLWSENVSAHEDSPAAFLDAWESAHAAIRRQLYRGPNFQAPHYIQADLATGAARAFWVDALSAYYPGLLALSGYVQEAEETHLLTTALWTRFSALPERYNLMTGDIEGGLGWWVGRPEFIESTYYLYRATEDPWYLYVGEMTLRDIKRRCWARCGWSGIQNVLTGELSDRMESFFLGETAKYLFLLFDPDHPLNNLDKSIVFSTEGHPLTIPSNVGTRKMHHKSSNEETIDFLATCPARAKSLPLTISQVAARGDVYHAASLARLNLMLRTEKEGLSSAGTPNDDSVISPARATSPSNYSYFPWTLPLEMVPYNAVSSLMPTHPTFELSFPTLSDQGGPLSATQRIKEGILINSLGGMRISMIQDTPWLLDHTFVTGYRIQNINGMSLGKDEKVYLAKDTGYGVLNPADPYFTRIRDNTMLDIVVDVNATTAGSSKTQNKTVESEISIDLPDLDGLGEGAVKSAWNTIIDQIANFMKDSQPWRLHLKEPPASLGKGTANRYYISAITPTGLGAAPLPDWIEAPSPSMSTSPNLALPWSKVYVTDELCEQKLSSNIPKDYEVIIVKRGHCSFSQKLANVPSISPSRSSLQLIIVVNYDLEDNGDPAHDFLIRPLLDQTQMLHSGLPRQNPLPMVMVGGGEKTYEVLRSARGLAVKRRYSVQTQGVPITNLVII